MAACPDGRCDGSGFLYDEERAAGAAVLVPAGAAWRASGRRRSPGGLPRRFREVSFDREPLVSIERAHPHVVREVRRYCDSIAEQLAAGRGMWFTGDVGHRQDDARDADLQGRDGGRPHGRDLLAAAAAGAAARDVPRRRAVHRSAS